MPIDFTKALKDRKPATEHPPLEEGFTRVRILDITNQTEKAMRAKLEDGTIWIPLSVCKLRAGNKTDGGTLEDVLDIQNWWYDKNIQSWD